MKQFAIKDPFLFGEWFDIFWFHSCHFTGMTQTIHERLGYGLSQFVAEQAGNVHRNYASRAEWSEVGRRYLAEVIAAPDKLSAVLTETRQAADDLIAFSHDLSKIDIHGLSSDGQTDWLRRYHAKQHVVWTIGMIPNVLELENSFLTDHLKSWLSDAGLTGSNAASAFQALITPRELSSAQREERDMLALAQDENPALREHWRKYSWLTFGWTGPSLTLDYFQEVYRGLCREGKAQARLKELIENDKKMLAEKQSWQERLRMPDDVALLFRLMEELLFVKAYRMDALFQSYEAVQPLLKKIAEMHYLSLSQVYAMYADWLAEMIENHTLDADRINAVADYSVRYFDGERAHLLVGEEARRFMQPLKALLPPVPAVSELRGQVAYPGVARGTVCIVNRAVEMPKFVDGQILVSNVTDPSLLPVMKKAVAFVTNQGGLTCHAAIVAREMKKPCVIGTKIATHVFKDGDVVEVDAVNGIVRKLGH